MKRLFISFLLSAIFSLSFTSLLIELEIRSILNDKVEIKIPKGFTVMDAAALKAKYPGQKPPTLVYTDGTGGINVAFNHTESKAMQQHIKTYADYLVKVFKETNPEAKWLGDGIQQIGGRDVGFIELVTKAGDAKIYNLMFFTDVDNRLLICSFNCTEKSIGEWKGTAHEIMNSLKVK